MQRLVIVGNIILSNDFSVLTIHGSFKCDLNEVKKALFCRNITKITSFCTFKEAFKLNLPLLTKILKKP